MKKVYLILAMLFGICFSGHSKEEEKTNVPVEIDPKIDKKPIRRAPAKIDIEVWYDSLTRQLEVISESEPEGEVYLYYGSEIVDYSPTIDAVFFMPELRGTFTVIIESENWTATGSLEL